MAVHHIGTSDTDTRPRVHRYPEHSAFPFGTVLLKFKRGITPTDIEKVRASLHALPSQIPAISSFKAGKKIKHPLDHDFDEGERCFLS